MTNGSPMAGSRHAIRGPNPRPGVRTTHLLTSHTDADTSETGQPAPPHQPIRIVRLRLALALLAAALLPFAVVAPVLRTVTDDTRAAETAALQQDVTALSGAVSVELERARLSLDPAVARAAQILAAPTKSTSHDLSQVLERLISPEGSIVSAALLDED